MLIFDPYAFLLKLRNLLFYCSESFSSKIYYRFVYPSLPLLEAHFIVTLLYALPIERATMSPSLSDPVKFPCGLVLPNWLSKVYLIN